MASVMIQNGLQSITKRKEGNAKEVDSIVFGKKIGLVTKLFGCWHNDISRPFVEGKTAYRSCLQCGARKQFNSQTLETYGNFFFPPKVK